MSGDPRQFVAVRDESHALIAVGTFATENEARRWANACFEGAECEKWGIAQVVAPENYDTARPEPRVRIYFSQSTRATAFAAFLHQLLPMLDVGGFDAIYDHAVAERHPDGRGEVFVVNLKRPLPDDLLDALVTLTRRTKLG
jgi:hypothetical protein